MKTSFNHISRGKNTLFLRHLACLSLLCCSASTYAATIDNGHLQVTLDTTTAEIQATDLDNSLVWTQEVVTGYHAQNIHVAGTNDITAVVKKGAEIYYIEILLADSPAKSFHLTVTPPDPDSTDNYLFVHLPTYPFFYTGTNSNASEWYYVQNNGGEGTMLPINSSTLRGRGGWAGSQPWWGVTNFSQSMMARLDTYARVQNPGANSDQSAYKIPMEIDYTFDVANTYVGMAKAYREYFLQKYRDAHSQDELPALADKAAADSKYSFLEDATYAYFWDETGEDFNMLLADMKTAGLDRVVAMFNLKDRDSALTPTMSLDIANAGWLCGLYRQPTPNIEKAVCTISNWVTKLLTHDNLTEDDVLQSAEDDNLHGWDNLFTTDTAPEWTDNGVPGLLTTYGSNLKLIYHDTLPQQTAPCIYGPGGDRTPPYYVEDIEMNQMGRQAILEGTRTNGLIAGSGEGVSAWWTIEHLDYWEGGMEESVYGDIDRHPITDHDEDFADQYYPGDENSDPELWWSTQESKCMDEKARIPLLALQWHDYVGETWNWRNSTFVVQNLSWKKDLFNILYGAMPMWHVSRMLWDDHKDDYIASYFKLLPVRRANGSAQMMYHGWVDVSPGDRLIQYTYWDNDNHVIVNFDEANSHSFTDPDYGTVEIPPKGYAMLPDPVSENCEGTGTPTGWANTGTVNWDYTTIHPEGAQAIYIPGTGVGGNSTNINFANQAEVWVYFKLALNGSAPTSAKTVGGLAANSGAITELFQIGASARPSFCGVQTTDGFSANTVYDVWLHYRKGTGSNAIVEIAFSTNGTKPTSGTKYASSTVYTGTNEAGRLFLGTTGSTSFNTVFDKIRVDNSEIGSNPP